MVMMAPAAAPRSLSRRVRDSRAVEQVTENWSRATKRTTLLAKIQAVLCLYPVLIRRKRT